MGKIFGFIIGYLIIMIIINIIELICIDIYPICYVSESSYTRSCCTGDGCNCKFTCKAYKNYIEDN